MFALTTTAPYRRDAIVVPFFPSHWVMRRSFLKKLIAGFRRRLEGMMRWRRCCGVVRHYCKTHHKTSQRPNYLAAPRTFSTARTGATQITIRQSIRPRPVDQSEAHASHIHRKVPTTSTPASQHLKNIPALIKHFFIMYLLSQRGKTFFLFMCQDRAKTKFSN